jgi:Ca2+-binding EF-hand superfamily protein
LRRSFKEEDRTNSGSVSIQVLKDILNQFKCPLNDEQFYVLISEIDTNLNGTINYNYFLQQYIKNT